jgi:hypothetical protein
MEAGAAAFADLAFRALALFFEVGLPALLLVDVRRGFTLSISVSDNDEVESAVVSLRAWATLIFFGTD